MKIDVKNKSIAFAIAAVLGAAAMSAAHANGHDDRRDDRYDGRHDDRHDDHHDNDNHGSDNPIADKGEGTYVTGDFHNHTTCSDGSISMQKLVKKSTDKSDTPWGLDWFVQAGHGGNGNRNCTLAEDATLATPAYPLVISADGATLLGPNTSWQNSNPSITPKGLVSGNAPNQVMWRWQSLQEYQYPIMEYLAALKGMPLFSGMESVVAGHEHSSMSVVTGQLPPDIYKRKLPKTAGYTPLGNATALAQWSYCFDRGDTDTSRGDTVVGSGIGNNWNCSVGGSANEADPSWNATAQKLIPAGGAGTGVLGHLKTVEALKWMKQKYGDESYYVPAHLERAGPFNPDGNNGFNIESLRDLNNAAPRVAFGFESQPGHGASDARGEYTVHRNNFGGTIGNVDSVGGTTWGGTGIYAGKVGGVWDALLGEGRNWWFFASSDWHNRGMFGPDDRRSSQDFFPGEYQRTAVMVRTKDDKGGHFFDSHDKGKGKSKVLTPDAIVDGLRTGNAFASSGQLIDRLAFVVCADTRINDYVGNALVEGAALLAAKQNTDVDLDWTCATMGEKLNVRKGQDVVVAIAVRDPSGTNYSPYTFQNPSLAQVGVAQQLNKPVLDHIDVIRGLVSGYKTPGAPDYSGEWPRNWISTPDLANVPEGAKNLSAAILRTFNQSNWNVVRGDKEYKTMVFRIRDVTKSQYVRLRGSNLPASVPYETDADGNPLADIATNAAAINPTLPGGADGVPAGANLRIPCKTVGTNVPATADIVYTGTAINGCPAHLPVVNGQKMVAYDVAAWSDLWFYSNPVYIEVKGSTLVAGVK
ncbi:MAG TPA: hypothetical protein VK624_09865 [Steroidobacteraceae bacterium]|nr:hypothetical protein [Steroidobacteraceae bacterium]